MEVVAGGADSRCTTAAAGRSVASLRTSHWGAAVRMVVALASLGPALEAAHLLAKKKSSTLQKKNTIDHFMHFFFFLGLFTSAFSLA